MKKARAKRNQRPSAEWVERDGRRFLVLENAHFRVELVPESGGAVTSYVHKASGIDVLWKNPLTPLAPKQVVHQPPAPGSDLFDAMDGSWFVSLPNGFFPGDYFGAALGTHGEIRSVPWEATKVRASGPGLHIVLEGMSARTPLMYRRELNLRSDSPRLEWTESVGNRSGSPLPVAWLQHPAFGGPLLAGARLLVPARTIQVTRTDSPSRMQLRNGYRGRWPFAPERRTGRMRDCSVAPVPASGLDHSVQLFGFREGRGCLWNDRLKLGFEMRWDLEMFPCAWSWAHASGGTPRYPMWGEGDLITLQPSTSPPAPFAELVRRKQVLVVPARSWISTQMQTAFVEGATPRMSP